jgi:small subunit ribosomal protein S1
MSGLELDEKEISAESKPDLSSLSSMLNARWKGGAAVGASTPEAVRAGQIRSFRITKLDPAAKRIELELAKPADARSAR